MTATNHTEHYGLSQYTGGDHPTYTGDYNGDMSKIDAAIYAASQTGGGMTTVEHTADLTGDGTDGNPLGVADTIARTTDVSALTSRIAALETKVSQLTSAVAPSTPGLTAEALDTQYFDSYNIVRTTANKE